jgi:hypothetical protein
VVGGLCVERNQTAWLWLVERAEGFLFLSSQMSELLRFLLIHWQLQGGSELEESMPQKHLLSVVDSSAIICRNLCEK